MANHCVNVICLKCGAGHCTRGCGYEHGPSPKYLKAYLDQAQQWADKFAGGRVSHVMTDIRCSCGGHMAID